ncbi:MAG: hypothetical protein AAF541_04350 [Pseudomonadota bacterium]
MDPESLPVAWANYISIIGFVFLLIVVWLIPRRVILADAKSNSRWRDIRIWATGLILMQITLYLIFT